MNFDEEDNNLSNLIRISTDRCKPLMQNRKSISSNYLLKKHTNAKIEEVKQSSQENIPKMESKVEEKKKIEKSEPLKV